MTKSWVIITGASRGLGSYLASSFWNKGFNLALVARDESALLQVCKDLPKKSDQSVVIFQCDFAQREDVFKLTEMLVVRLPRLDVLINNAAIHGPIGPLVENNLRLWNEAVQVNLMAPVALCHGLVGLMAKSGGGSIINLSGGGATSPRSNFSAYASSKAALVRFSEILAKEVFAQNIRVNCIAPGAMKTDLLSGVIKSGAHMVGEHEFEIAKKIIGQGGASMDKVADLVLFLASDISRGITGKLISAVWDNWREWINHPNQISTSDVYTLRRISGRDRGMGWGDL